MKKRILCIVLAMTMLTVMVPITLTTNANSGPAGGVTQINHRFAFSDGAWIIDFYMSHSFLQNMIQAYSAYSDVTTITEAISAVRDLNPLGFVKKQAISTVIKGSIDQLARADIGNGIIISIRPIALHAGDIRPQPGPPAPPPPPPRDISINATAEPANGGTVRSLMAYRGEFVFLVARPTSGWRFDGWYENNRPVFSGNDSQRGRNATLGFEARQDRTLEARFVYTGEYIEADFDIRFGHTCSFNFVGYCTICGADGGVPSGYGSNGRFLAPIEPPMTGSIPISTREELHAIRYNLGGNQPRTANNFHLTNDIDLAGADWVPIGNLGNSVSFSGTFDGQGFVIRNMRIVHYEETIGDRQLPVGGALFGHTGHATVRNLGMEGTYVRVTGSAGSIGVAGTSIRIYNSYNTGNITSMTRPAHGLGGDWINYSYNTGDVTSFGASAVGLGTAGARNSFNTGNITAISNSRSASAAGVSGGSGLLGATMPTSLDQVEAATFNSFNTGNVSATALSTRGGRGTVYVSGVSNGTVANSYNTGNVFGSGGYSNVFAGGITAVGSFVRNSYNVGRTSAVTTFDTGVGSGGIYGRRTNSITPEWYLENNYSFTAGFSRGGYGTLLTAAEMRNAASFTGFDFSNVWGMGSNVNNGLPYLRFFSGGTAITPPPPTTSNEISVTLNDIPIAFDVPPMIVNGRTMVPFRAIFESFGLFVDWDNDTRTAVGMQKDLDIHLPIDSNIAFVNGEPVEIDAPAMIYGGRTLVPVRFIAEAIGANVDWCNETRTVIIQGWW